MFSTQNVSIVNHIIACCGFFSGTKSSGQSTGNGKNFHFATDWKVITEDQWVLRTVQGFLIPFREEPCQVHLPQPCRYLDDQVNLLCQEVTSLVQKGAVVTVVPSEFKKGFYLTLFLVPKLDSPSKPSTFGYVHSTSRRKGFIRYERL